MKSPKKINKRLSGFEAFVEQIEAGADPSGALQERFEAKPRQKNVAASELPAANPPGSLRHSGRRGGDKTDLHGQGALR
jgi:hypothetical protein